MPGKRYGIIIWKIISERVTPVHRGRAVDYPHEGRPEYAEDDYRGRGAAEGRHQRHGVGAVYHGRYRAEHFSDGQKDAAQERRHPREEAERHARRERDRHAGAEQRERREYPARHQPAAVPEGLEYVARRRQKYRVRYLQVHGGELPRGESENRGAGYRGALGRRFAPAQQMRGVEALYQRERGYVHRAAGERPAAVVKYEGQQRGEGRLRYDDGALHCLASSARPASQNRSARRLTSEKYSCVPAISSGTRG